MTNNKSIELASHVPSLEDYFKTNLQGGIIDFSLRAETGKDGRIFFYIHPQGKDGVTTDFIVHGNSLFPRFS